MARSVTFFVSCFSFSFFYLKISIKNKTIVFGCVTFFKKKLKLKQCLKMIILNIGIMFFLFVFKYLKLCHVSHGKLLHDIHLSSHSGEARHSCRFLLAIFTRPVPLCLFLSLLVHRHFQLGFSRFSIHLEEP